MRSLLQLTGGLGGRSRGRATTGANLAMSTPGRDGRVASAPGQPCAQRTDLVHNGQQGGTHAPADSKAPTADPWSIGMRATIATSTDIFSESSRISPSGAM